MATAATAFYPLRLWKPGNVIIDERIIDVPPQADRAQLLIELGVYERATNQRVKVHRDDAARDRSGHIAGQFGRKRAGRDRAVKLLRV